jgi:hypothetical protein
MGAWGFAGRWGAARILRLDYRYLSAISASPAFNFFIFLSFVRLLRLCGFLSSFWYRISIDLRIVRPARNRDALAERLA